MEFHQTDTESILPLCGYATEVLSGCNQLKRNFRHLIGYILMICPLIALISIMFYHTSRWNFMYFIVIIYLAMPW